MEKEVMSFQLQTRIEKSEAPLDWTCILVVRLPMLIALYFKNITRRPVEALGAALRQILPSLALLGISFVGGAILDIITDSLLKDHVVASMKLVGIVHVPPYDIFQTGHRVPFHNQASILLDTAKLAAKKVDVCPRYSGNKAATVSYEVTKQIVDAKLKQATCK